jgi:tetratricopeptide (TPR) repeat protein
LGILFSSTDKRLRSSSADYGPKEILQLLGLLCAWLFSFGNQDSIWCLHCHRRLEFELYVNPASDSSFLVDFEYCRLLSSIERSEDAARAVIAPCNEAIQLKPDYAEAFSNRGNAYDHKGNYDRAVQDYNQAIRLKPDFSTAFNDRGNTYYQKSEYDRAIQDYNEAVRLKPENVESYYNRGNAYYQKSEYDRAIQDYNEAIRLKPDYVKAYNNRGAAYYDTGDYDRAIQDYSESIRLKPDYVDALRNRGNA